jgi:hypothetical protein
MPLQCSSTERVLDASFYGCFTGDFWTILAIFWTAEAMSDVADFTIMRKRNCELLRTKEGVLKRRGIFKVVPRCDVGALVGFIEKQ